MSPFTTTTTSISLGVKSSLIFLATYFAPTSELVILIFILVFSDLITGIWAAVKEKRKIKSKGLKRTTIKLLIYLLVVMLTFLTENILFGITNLLLTKIIASYIVLTELSSNFENCGKIVNKGNLFLQMYKVLATYINKNKDIINKIDPEGEV